MCIMDQEPPEKDVDDDTVGYGGYESQNRENYPIQWAGKVQRSKPEARIQNSTGTIYNTAEIFHFR